MSNNILFKSLKMWYNREEMRNGYDCNLYYRWHLITCLAIYFLDRREKMTHEIKEIKAYKSEIDATNQELDELIEQLESMNEPLSKVNQISKKILSYMK